MIKLQVEGQPNHVKSFLQDIGQRPQIELVHQEVHNRGMTGQVDVSVSCYIRYLKESRQQTIQMETAEGVKIDIPMWDLIAVEIEKGVRVFAGKVF
ncbi:hypothetical protein [Lihuaxuella thermophila]|uniref:Uncharacterized protein n=1 Tax=Lihuaxuella thermophila TaxID=1173111 RepID=A0A1H8BQY1_9BACL|nr:hypothetical protein [Lihuaxuella thermophila]SEM85213.1 hypothetical protein SAMN05444955_102312 [Lihuaxuella thermophila]